MRYELLQLSGDPAGLAAKLRARVPAAEQDSGTVAEIIAMVRDKGDTCVGADPPPADRHVQPGPRA